MSASTATRRPTSWQSRQLKKRAVRSRGQPLPARSAQGQSGVSGSEFDPKAASKLLSSDGGDSEYDRGARRGDLARTTRRITARVPSTQDRDLSNGRLGGDWELPRSVSAIWASYKAALLQHWAKDWSAAMSGASLRAIAKFPPGPSYSLSIHAQLTRRQSTLFSRLRTGICDLGADRAHLNPEKQMCECGEVESANTSSCSAPFTLPLVPLSSLNSTN